jgi:hypothetical protein
MPVARNVLARHAQSRLPGRATVREIIRTKQRTSSRISVDDIAKQMLTLRSAGSIGGTLCRPGRACLQVRGTDAILLNCIGFTEQHEAVRSLGLPDILSNAVAAKGRSDCSAATATRSLMRQ